MEPISGTEPEDMSGIPPQTIYASDTLHCAVMTVWWQELLNLVSCWLHSRLSYWFSWWSFNNWVWKASTYTSYLIRYCHSCWKQWCFAWITVSLPKRKLLTESSEGKCYWISLSGWNTVVWTNVFVTFE